MLIRTWAALTTIGWSTLVVANAPAIEPVDVTRNHGDSRGMKPKVDSNLCEDTDEMAQAGC